MDQFEILQKTLDKASQLLSPICSETLHTTLTKYTILRPSLMQLQSRSYEETIREMIGALRKQGPYSRVLDAASSDSDSDEEGFPSVRRAAEAVLDAKDLSLTDKYSDEPPALILLDIDPRFRESSLFKRLHSPGLVRVNYAVVAFGDRFSDCAILHFNSLESARSVHARLSKEKATNRLGSWLYNIAGSQHSSEVKWFFNPTRVPDHDYHGLVLRNIDRQITEAQILQELELPRARIEPIRRIRKYPCTVVVLRELHELYQLFKRLSPRRLRYTVDIHPHSSVFKAPHKAVLDMVRGVSQLGSEETLPQKRQRVSEPEDEEKPTTSEIHEEGEISEPDLHKASGHSYSLFELPGMYICANGEAYKHSGHLVSTFLAKA